jgi:hypothetical protein
VKKGKSGKGSDAIGQFERRGWECIVLYRGWWDVNNMVWYGMMGDMSERKNSTRREKGWMDGGWKGRKARLKEGE